MFLLLFNWDVTPGLSDHVQKAYDYVRKVYGGLQWLIFDSLRSQIVISKGKGGRRTLPYAFTEHGAVMADLGIRQKENHSLPAP